jgi:group I intron endonuclease
LVKYYIYKITNNINNKSYIGQSLDFKKRWKTHISDALRKTGKTHITKKFAIHHAINHYGVENFNFEVIQECDSLEEANLLEISYIEKFNTLAPLGYNLTTGGHNSSPSPEIKEKIREKLKIVSYFNIAKPHPNLGRQLPEEIKTNLSRKNSGDLAGAKKITSAQAKEIYLKALANVSTQELMASYQLSQNTILNILNKKSWKEILNDLPAINMANRNRGSNRFNAKLNKNQIQEIMNLYKNGVKQVEICKIYHIKPSHCSLIVNNKIWKYIDN